MLGLPIGSLEIFKKILYNIYVRLRKKKKKVV